MDSMLCTNKGSTASHDYIGSERRAIMAEEIGLINPFSKDREKITFFHKGGATPFSGLNLEKVDRFTKRNQANFNKHFPQVVLRNPL